MRCLEAEGNRLLIYRRKLIASSNLAAYDILWDVSSSGRAGDC